MWSRAAISLLLFMGTCALTHAQMFSESALQLGIEHECLGYQDFGGGMAWFDYDNDGFEDLYLCGGQHIDVLYRNNGDNTFTDMSDVIDLSETAIRTTLGVVTGDLDNDGDRDILVTTWNAGTGLVLQRNLLYRNNGDGTFTETGEAAGLAELKLSTACSMIDINSDGYLDLYVGNYLEDGGLLYDEQGNTIGFAHICFEDELYLNNTNFTFTKANTNYWTPNNGCTLALLPTDYDRDGVSELMVSNDFGEWVEPNRLYREDPDGFGIVDVAEETETDIEIYGMGIAVADYDLDLDLDYYFTNLGDNQLFEQQADGTFLNTAETAGVVNGNFVGEGKAVGWGTFFADINNDRYPDLYIANGYIPAISWLNNHTAQENKLYRNQGDGTFVDVTSTELPFNEWRSRGAAYTDFNNDGNLDFGVSSLVNGLEWPPARFQAFYNSGENAGNYISFDLEGILCNRDAYGSQIEIYTPSGTQLNEVQSGSSHMCQNSSRVHFGLGNELQVDSAQIFWPGGEPQMLYSPLINMLHSVLQDTTTVVVEEPEDTTHTNWIVSLPAGEGVERIPTSKRLASPNQQFVLDQTLTVFPNPVEEVLGLQFQLLEPGPISLELLDATGRHVHTWWKGNLKDGNHELQLLRPAHLSAGSYLLTVRIGRAVAVRRLHFTEG